MKPTPKETLNLPMKQFEVIAGALCVIDTSKYDAFYGFRRVVKDLNKKGTAQ